MKQIQNIYLPPKINQTVVLNEGYKILNVIVDRGLPFLVVINDLGHAKVDVEIKVVQDGVDFPDSNDYKYIGTALNNIYGTISFFRRQH